MVQVVQRKNGDSQKRDLEVNKSIADVMIARSDGTSRYGLIPGSGTSPIRKRPHP
jgi:hypothetical protein